MKQKVILLYGGRSAEHEVSVSSAASVLEAIDKTLFETIPVGITKSGKWVGNVNPKELLASGKAMVPEPPPENGIGSIARLISQGDVVFPVLHGTYGEDGAVQGLLEMVGIPYVGAGVTGSALGMDKVFMKAVFRSVGIPVVPYLWVTAREYTASSTSFLDEVEETLSYPMFVKPANLGSSVGISKARNRAALVTAIDLALKYDRKIIVEQGVAGREIEISVLGNEVPVTSLPGEIVPNAEFYDYDAKYISDSVLHIPAQLSNDQVQIVQELAVKAYNAIDCCGLARVDFFLISEDELVVNEINTMPGFTRSSMYPKMWHSSGLLYKDLITKLINLAFGRFEDRRRICVDRAELPKD